ncbi:MAG: ribosome biogenesis GTPase Der [Polyangiaceae bacterium]
MSLPIVAIVGRPNVGKSTLFNRLAGDKLAIVHDEPGVTRDRHYADVQLNGRSMSLVDTGGFEPSDSDSIAQGIARHVREAVEEADVVLCIFDGRLPPTQADAAMVSMLRQLDKPVVYAANRMDNSALVAEATELYSLGIEALHVSALHGRGMSELADSLIEKLPPGPPAAVEEEFEPFEDEEGGPDEDEVVERIPRVALIGRPNAGKSSLFNRLLGVERALVDPTPGTTRDAIDTTIEFEGKTYTIVDTAGIRRRPKVESGVEAASVMRALRALGRADVAVVLCDAVGGFAEQDARLLGLVNERARAVVVGMNKTDLLSAADLAKATQDARDQLHFAQWVPVMPVSTKTGRGVKELMQRVTKSYQEYSTRIGTSALNRFLEDLIARHPPPVSGLKSPRLFYMTQAAASPPVFVVMASAPEAISTSYRRFLMNQIRKTFGFDSVPVVVRYRNRRRRDD